MIHAAQEGGRPIEVVFGVHLRSQVHWVCLGLQQICGSHREGKQADDEDDSFSSLAHVGGMPMASLWRLGVEWPDGSGRSSNCISPISALALPG